MRWTGAPPPEPHHGAVWQAIARDDTNAEKREDVLELVAMACIDRLFYCLLYSVYTYCIAFSAHQHKSLINLQYRCVQMFIPLKPTNLRRTFETWSRTAKTVWGSRMISIYHALASRNATMQWQIIDQYGSPRLHRLTSGQAPLASPRPRFSPAERCSTQIALLMSITRRVEENRSRSPSAGTTLILVPACTTHFVITLLSIMTDIWRCSQCIGTVHEETRN